MPFGLKNAPSIFQRLMNTVVTGLQGLQCFAYWDEFVIYAISITEHWAMLKSIFDHLRTDSLKFQPHKCKFMRHEVAYLRHILSEHGVFPNPDKISAISTYPTPKSQKQIKQFLDLIGYCFLKKM